VELVDTRDLKEFRMKVYGPYLRKDGRKIVILYENGERKTVSYPKYLVEEKFGIKLKETETIDHIDGNINNDDFSNLRIIERVDHIKDDVKRLKPKKFICIECGNSFISTRKYRKGIAGPFCSKNCSGKYGQRVQIDKNEKLQDHIPVIEYYKLKDSKFIEPIIGNNNSGRGDIGEALTGNADGNTEGTGNRTP
jgi:hypothetical protein